jgi:basic amino acid/polyamine antiporter, APA family
MSVSVNMRKIGLGTAISLVIANMIGTGVFTSLGYQVKDIHSVFAVLMLWVIGGIISLCGALVYGEIGKMFPNSGGEYNYLSKIYHPSIGFLAGWVSATVGFAAPIAMAAMALSTYTHSVFESVNEKVLAVTTIIIITAIHSFNLKAGSLFQRIVTVLKVCVIVFIIIAGFTTKEHQTNLIAAGDQGWDIIFSGSFAIALYFVTYSYSGWNASAYMAGEIENPKRNLPRSLFVGTFVVTALYVLLNFIFLYTTPMNEYVSVAANGEVSGRRRAIFLEKQAEI